MKKLKSALEEQEQIKKRLIGKKVAVFLDYDGTLTPIVSRPELAILSQNMRQTIHNLSKVCPVAIISGRARGDVEKMVGLPELFYAGSHGFDIRGPGVAMTPPEVEPILPKIEQASRYLKKATQAIEGCLVENKKYALAVHFRLCADEDIPVIEQLVDQVVTEEPNLRKTGGKKIFEIRANFPWDKGKALNYFLEVLDLSGTNILPFYLGDDETDEDAFIAIKDSGIGILVEEETKNSNASYGLRNVEEVQRFLNKLAEWLS
ncbi:MAG: trehalose-phosphatase [bacterium]|nr:trehalose-phosphatase [bacterium]